MPVQSQDDHHDPEDDEHHSRHNAAPAKDLITPHGITPSIDECASRPVYHRPPALATPIR
jgi:hypothetical protein